MNLLFLLLYRPFTSMDVNLIEVGFNLEIPEMQCNS